MEAANSMKAASCVGSKPLKQVQQTERLEDAVVHRLCLSSQSSKTLTIISSGLPGLSIALRNAHMRR